jgi:glucuronokinase
MGASGLAFARAALAGNPSDGYGGATLAMTLPTWSADAQATLVELPAPAIDPPSELVEATVHRFAREVGHPAGTAAVSWRSSIPHSVGLGGSSAIVIATLRALCRLYGAALGTAELARLALAIEVEELGIAAGLQDRVAQSFGGLTFMDFDPRHIATLGHGHYETLDPDLLPPLVVAYRSDSAAHSGGVHGDLRARYERGETRVRGAMSELAELARSARTALLAREHDAFARCVDASFDARTRMIELDPRHVEMIDSARAAGASANYTGSGGAIICVCRDGGHRAEVVGALADLGCTTLICH